MQLDNARIAIRERSFPDILDLSLRVFCARAWPLTLSLALGIVPLALFNRWLLSGLLVESEYYETFPGWYLFWYLVLAIWETPLATAVATLYLGQASFLDRPEPRLMARSFFGSLPQLILYQVILRGLLAPWVISWWVLYAIWPYLNEVILLERNPWRRRGGSASSFSRSSAIHSLNLGELFSRWLTSCVAGTGLFFSLWLSIIYVRELVTFTLPFDYTSYTLYMPITLWIVIGYFTVVRFLSYLDVRIRTEGWEVELQMRAEAARLANPWLHA